ncbi:MAG TPA: hypothetical protein VGG03_23790 [Thermoanaerobaculia bacterium]|jgi:hypothetical protein
MIDDETPTPYPLQAADPSSGRGDHGSDSGLDEKLKRDKELSRGPFDRDGLGRTRDANLYGDETGGQRPKKP